jgi:hypothetical protein
MKSTGSTSRAVRPTVCDETGVAGGVQGTLNLTSSLNFSLILYCRYWSNSTRRTARHPSGCLCCGEGRCWWRWKRSRPEWCWNCGAPRSATSRKCQPAARYRSGCRSCCRLRDTGDRKRSLYSPQPSSSTTGWRRAEPCRSITEPGCTTADRWQGRRQHWC